MLNHWNISGAVAGGMMPYPYRDIAIPHHNAGVAFLRMRGFVHGSHTLPQRGESDPFCVSLAGVRSCGVVCSLPLIPNQWECPATALNAIAFPACRCPVSAWCPQNPALPAHAARGRRPAPPPGFAGRVLFPLVHSATSCLHIRPSARHSAHCGPRIAGIAANREDASNTHVNLDELLPIAYVLCMIEDEIATFGDDGLVKPEFDWGRPGSRPFGLSELQYRLAQGLLRGMTRTAAASEAGYKGEGATLRSSASAAAKSRPVQAAIAAYRNWQGRSDEIEVMPAELKAILSKAIRHPATPGERVQAASLLQKIQADEDSYRKTVELTAEKIVEGLEDIIGAVAVGKILKAFGFDPPRKANGAKVVPLQNGGA